VPAGIQSGDVLIAQIAIFDAVGGNVPAIPSGWTQIRHDSGFVSNRITTWLYFHVAGGSEPPSYSWNISSQFAAGVMGAWRGVSMPTPIDQSSGTTAGGPSPVSASAPSLTPAHNNELQLYFYASQSASAATITEPAAITQRSNTMSTKEGFTLAFGDLAAPPQGNASPTYTATATLASNSPVMSAQAVLLRLGP
jgi:hypothetical protein